MPKKARIYWVCICVLGLASVAMTFIVHFPVAQRELWEAVVFPILGFLIGGRKVNLMSRKKDEESGSLSLGFAITFACLIRLGPGLAVVVALASCLSGCLFPRRQKIHQLLFNLSLSAIDGLLGGLVFAMLNGWSMTIRHPQTFIALAASSLTFLSINLFGVAVMISLHSGEKAFNIWKDKFVWAAPSFLVSGFAGAFTTIVFGNNAVPTLMFLLAVAYCVHQWMVTYTAREQERITYIEEMEKKQAQLADLYLATIKSLALAIDAKDQYTHQHIIRVQRYAVAIAKELKVEGPEFEAVQTGALLHDIGKLGVPEYVLLKSGPLTNEEIEKVRKHPEIGAAILDPVDFPYPVVPVVRNHHERWDGQGYPDKLKGEDIPLTARIMSVADVYDALTSTRSYRKACSHEQAVVQIQEGSGTQFSPEVVDAFVRIIDGVVQEMAAEGVGPLVQSVQVREESKASQAAKQISRASTELRALYEVAHTLSGNLGVRHTSELVVRKVEEIYPGATCVFLLREPDSNRLVADSVHGVSRELFVNAYTASETSLSCRVLESNRSVAGTFDSSDLTFVHGAQSAWSQPKTSLIVPVYSDNRPVGTINLYHQSEHAFSDYDVELLELIAERASSALYNGILFERARGDSLTDPLTGTYNLRHLNEHVESLVGKDREFSLLCLDLDSFKPVNDLFGHAKGNTILKDIAKILSEMVGSDGIVSRYGGDEFVVVLSEVDRDRAQAFVARLQEEVLQYEPLLDHPKLGQLKVGVSVGMASYPEDGLDCSSLLSVADHRMYIMKTERKLIPLAKAPESSSSIDHDHDFDSRLSKVSRTR